MPTRSIDSNDLLHEVGRRAAAETSYVAPAAGEAVGSAVGSALGSVTARSLARHTPALAASVFVIAAGAGATFAYRVVTVAFGRAVGGVAAGGILAAAGLVVAAVVKTGRWTARTPVAEPDPIYPTYEGPAPPKGME